MADASALERNLYLTLQLIELGKPVILALNMMDIVQKRGMEIDLHRLPEMLGIPVIPVSARRKTGLDILMHAAAHHKDQKATEATSHHHTEQTRHRHDHHGEYVMVYSDEIEDKIDLLMDALKKKYPKDELWLLMGTDMFLTLHLWHEPEALMRLANIGTFARGDAGEQEMFARMLPLLEHNFHATIRRIPMETKKAASGEIRARLARGEGADLLSVPVWGYIQREHLYGTKADLRHLQPDALRSVALSYLKCTRMAHVLGTEQEAVRLARRCGADETEARTAALLHDCTKKCSREAQLALCERYGLTADEVERSQDQLLHAKTGAALARDVVGISDAVYGAIRWHTTGKANMTPLEKVIYVADCIEPSRKYPGVESLRQATEESLDQGLELCLQRTVERMEKLGSPVHEKTLEALHFLKGQR